MNAQEPRPAFHFTAAEGWINDPFGVTWKDGETSVIIETRTSTPKKRTPETLLSIWLDRELAVARVRAVSPARRPCWRRKRRSVLLARDRSWVTTRIVVLWSRLSELSSSMMCSPVCSSRLPVGSPARMSLGSLA